MSNALFALTLVAALGCGLVAGVFVAFSAGVMQALRRLSPAEGIAAMQSINITIINPLFMAGFLGTALVSLLAMIAAVLRDDGPSVAYTLLGGAFYLLGCFGVTMARNVPMNNTLGALNPTNPASANYWATYLANWTAWNHLRTAASLAAATLFTLALCI